MMRHLRQILLYPRHTLVAALVWAATTPTPLTLTLTLTLTLILTSRRWFGRPQIPHGRMGQVRLLARPALTGHLPANARRGQAVAAQVIVEDVHVVDAVFGREGHEPVVGTALIVVGQVAFKPLALFDPSIRRDRASRPDMHGRVAVVRRWVLLCEGPGSAAAANLATGCRRDVVVEVHRELGTRFDHAERTDCHNKWTLVAHKLTVFNKRRRV